MTRVEDAAGVKRPLEEGSAEKHQRELKKWEQRHLSSNTST